MLVLTRKVNEQIVIGDNIKITLLRVRGNSIRLGIDAPPEVRIIRSELESRDPKSDTEVDVEIEIDDRGQVFAHPQVDSTRPPKERSSQNRVGHLIEESEAIPAGATNRSIFVGRIHRPERDQSGNSPLSTFMSPR